STVVVRHLYCFSTRRSSDLIWPLPVGRINGIGPKAQARLNGMRITTIGELARTPLAVLAEAFSHRYSRWLLEAAHGRDERPVVRSDEHTSELPSREKLVSRL